VFAFIYLGLMFGFVMALRREHSAWVVLGVLVVTKACDIGAYTTGKLIGKHKLIPWVSPGKTWEGLAGGLAFSAGAAMLGLWLAHRAGADPRFGGLQRMSFPVAAATGVVFGLTGQAGDLLASVLKRDAKLKDSGSIPGFGGILDLVDSVLLVAPVAFWLLKRY
jgi:phosphatidate cytidylyltransferase